MKHNIPLTDIECMVVLDALSILIQNPEKKEIDKQLAERIRLAIFEIVKADKTPAKVTDLSQKCGSCKWLNKEKKTSVGYVCENPNKEWRTSIAHLKPKTCKACKEYEKKDYVKKGGADNEQNSKK